MNNLLKSVFISAYVTLLAVGVLHGVYGVTDKGVLSAWLGVLIALVPGLAFFAWIFLGDVVRTNENLLFLVIASILGVLSMTWLDRSGISLFWLMSYGVGVGLGGSLLYIFWYSRFQREENELLAVGQALPAFELENENGDPVKSSAFTSSPSLLIFYRGNWCPLCMAQIKEVAGQYQALSKRGVNVLLISPQPHDNTRSLAEKFDVPFQFLVDTGNKVAKLLGIYAQHGTPKGMEVFGYDSDTVMPTVIMTDSKGKIIFADLTDNYRVRPEPETFIRVLDEHGYV